MYKHDMLVLDAATEAEAAGKAASPPHFHRLYNETVTHYILNHPVLQQKVRGTGARRVDCVGGVYVAVPDLSSCKLLSNSRRCG